MPDGDKIVVYTNDLKITTEIISYSPSTNFHIHSASEELNDPDIIEFGIISILGQDPEGNEKSFDPDDIPNLDEISYLVLSAYKDYLNREIEHAKYH